MNSSLLHATECVLPDPLRSSAEAALGMCFASVRVHMNQVPALFGVSAFCAGEEVWVLPPGLRPRRNNDPFLLAHELAHIAQFRTGRVRAGLAEPGFLLHDAELEEEADWLAKRILAATPTRLTIGRGPSIPAGLPFRDNPPLHPGFRLSESGDFAIVHFWTGEVRLYAVQTLVDAANRELRDSRPGVRSMVSLHLVENGTRTINDKTLIRVLPRWHRVEAPPNDGHPDLNALNADGQPYITWSDCHRNSQTVMGARRLSDPLNNTDLIRPLVLLGGAERVDVYTPLESALGCKDAFGAAKSTSELANRGAYAVFRAIGGQPRDVVPPVTRDELLLAWRSYFTRYLGGGDEERQYEHSHQINHFIQPRPGEGLAILPAKIDPRFCSDYAWTDLKRRVDADLLAAIGLTDAAPPNYDQMVRALDGIEFDPRLTDAQRLRFTDQMLRTQAAEKLASPYCHLDEPRTNELLRRLRDRSIPFETAIQDVTDAELVELLRSEAIYMGHPGDFRDTNINQASLDSMFVTDADRLVTAAMTARARQLLTTPISEDNKRPLRDVSQYLEGGFSVENLINDRLSSLRQMLDPARWNALAAELTPALPAAAPLPGAAAMGAPSGPPPPPPLLVPKGPPLPPPPGAPKLARAPSGQQQQLRELVGLTQRFFAGTHPQEYNEFNSRRDKPAYVTAFKRQFYEQYCGFPGGVVTRTLPNWIRVFRLVAPRTFKNAWNFHWAGVVLTDDRDFVTLENLSVEAANYANGKWYFAMYRRLQNPDDSSNDDNCSQTFHGQMLATGGFGNVALTMSYKAFLPTPPVAAGRVAAGSDDHTTIDVGGPPVAAAAGAPATGGSGEE